MRDNDLKGIFENQENKGEFQSWRNGREMRKGEKEKAEKWREGKKPINKTLSGVLAIVIQEAEVVQLKRKGRKRKRKNNTRT